MAKDSHAPASTKRCRITESCPDERLEPLAERNSQDDIASWRTESPSHSSSSKSPEAVLISLEKERCVNAVKRRRLSRN